MGIEAKLTKSAEHIGAIVVLYADDPNGARELLDDLSSERGRKRETVRLNLVLLFAWAAMRKAAQLLGEHPPVVQFFVSLR